MAELESRYHDKPVHFFHVLSGENTAQVVDFQKHYRSNSPHLLDGNYRVKEAYHANSWPSYVLIDAEGNLAGRWVGMNTLNLAAALGKLDEVLKEARGGPPKGACCVGDICYVRAATDVYESQPTLTTDSRGQLHLVFVRTQGGSGDLFHRVLQEGKWSEPQRITSSAADDYAPHVCPDQGGGLWLVWCSNRAPSGKYDVYAQQWTGGQWSAPERVTESNDDAAHPRAAVDAQGHLWVTYYKWIPERKWFRPTGRSRDREIFVRQRPGDSWSEEVQVSPTNVPDYEDHADPSIAADSAGSIWITWAWDTHPREGSWPYPPTFGSTIFARQLRAGQPPSQLEMVGIRAVSLPAAMEQPTWSMVPEVLCRGDQPWFAFAAHSAVRPEHYCAVTAYVPGEGFPAPNRLGIGADLVCTPRLVAERNGGLLAIWSARVDEHYAVHMARGRAASEWGSEKLLWDNPQADVREAAAAVDADGRLHIAAVVYTPRQSRVEVQAFELTRD